MNTTVASNSVPTFQNHWEQLRAEAQEMRDNTPELKRFIDETILDQSSLSHALSHILVKKLAADDIDSDTLHEIFLNTMVNQCTIRRRAESDMAAYVDRDPACHRLITPFFFYKGFHSLQLHRIGHCLWQQDRQDLALYLQSITSERFSVDIHPAARIGNGIMIDHATSIIIGETAVVGNNVSMLHEVTLGGTGKECGDRHPKVGDGVLLGAGAKVLGNIRIGNHAKVAASSVVLDEVPDNCTVAGVPAKVVGTCCNQPALNMDHRL